MDTDLRALVLPLAWFPPDQELFGVKMRSLSLLSHQAVKVMGLKLLTRGHEYDDPLDEIREVLAYAWLHTAPIETISPALWSGAWRAEMDYTETSPAATLALIDQWRVFRERLLGLLDATRIRILPRKKSANDDTPSNVIGPSLLSQQIALVGKHLGESREYITWHLPLWEAWQIYHVATRGGGAWTVPDVQTAKIADSFEDFSVGALTPEA
jgi:hypothetical protein